MLAQSIQFWSSRIKLCSFWICKSACERSHYFDSLDKNKRSSYFYNEEIILCNNVSDWHFVSYYFFGFHKTPRPPSIELVNWIPSFSRAFLMVSKFLKWPFGTPSTDSNLLRVVVPIPVFSDKSSKDHRRMALAALNW